MRLAREDGRVIALEEHDAIFDEAFGIFSSRLYGIPAEITRDLALRDTIDGKIRAAMNSAADAFQKAGERLRQEAS